MQAGLGLQIVTPSDLEDHQNSLQKIFSTIAKLPTIASRKQAVVVNAPYSDRRKKNLDLSPRD